MDGIGKGVDSFWQSKHGGSSGQDSRNRRVVADNKSGCLGGRN